MLRFLFTVVRRDVLLAARRRGDWLTAQFFFVIVVSMFPLGIGPEPGMLRSIGPGVVWVAALLASLLSLDRLFADDYRDGTLEQAMLSPCPIALLTLGKAIAHWVINGIPLLLIAPLLGVQFNLPAEALWMLVLSLAIGTPILSLLGSIGAALTLGLRGGGALVTADHAALCAGPDFRCRRGGGRALRQRLGSASFAAGGVSGVVAVAGALGERHGA